MSGDRRNQPPRDVRGWSARAAKDAIRRAHKGPGALPWPEARRDAPTRPVPAQQGAK